MMKKIVIIVSIVVVAGGAVYLALTNNDSPIVQSLQNAVQNNQNDNQQDLNKVFSQGKCQGQDRVTFTSPMVRPEDTAYIIPLGLMVKGHVTPIDHQYYYPRNMNAGTEYPVYAPADGVIVAVGRHNQQVEKHLQQFHYDQVDVAIEHSCRSYSFLGLMSTLEPSIVQAAGGLEENSGKNVRIPVKAGQVVGTVGGHSLDVTVYDQEHTLSGFLRPESYQTQAGKLHIVNMFDYYAEPVKSQLLALNPRTIEPRGGKIDYDVDGKLIGTWFIQGTNGYDGAQRDAYWRGHLSFAPNVLDPTFMMISIGTFNGETDGYQFGIKGNGPDPATVNMSSGLVKYELVNLQIVDANGQGFGGPTSSATAIHGQLRSEVEGVMLVQLLGDRLLKVETFPRKTAAEVFDFTANAQLYER